MKHPGLFGLMLGLCVSVASSARGDDISTRDGKVYRDARIVSVIDGIATIDSKGGTARVSWDQLSAEDQSRYQEAELRRKAQEIERLKEELARREAELDKLRQEKPAAVTTPPTSNQSVTPRSAVGGAPGTSASPAAIMAPAPVVPARPVSSWPEIQETSVVDARELAATYMADPDGADRHFKGRTFVVKGVARRFHTALFVRTYEIILDGTDRIPELEFRFGYAPDWKAVFAADSGRELIATVERGRMTLMKRGESVRIRGTCQGLSKDQLVFKNAMVLRD